MNIRNTLTTFAGRTTLAGRPSYGTPVTFADTPPRDDGHIVLAYEVKMGDGEVALSKQDFEQCCQNFARYPHVPVAIEHADTAMPFENPPREWREPNGHIESLRVGTMSRTMPDGTARDVATLEGKPSYLEPTATDVANKKWRAGSITILHNAVDEESGAKLGSMLWSWSLTAHPRLTGLPPMQHSRRLRRTPEGTTTEAGWWYGTIDDRDDLVACLREIFDLPVTSTEAEVLAELDKLATLADGDGDTSGIDVDRIVGQLRDALRLPALSTTADVLAEVRKGLETLPTESTDTSTDTSLARVAGAKEPTTMAIKFLALVATFGLSFNGTTEEDAEKFTLSLARDGAAARRSLALGPDAAVEPALTALSARVIPADAVVALGLQPTATATELTARVTELAQAEATRLAADRATHVDDVLEARGLDEAMRPALLSMADRDPVGFAKAYPRPTREEMAQRRQDTFRTTREVPVDRTAPRPTAGGPTAIDLSDAAHALMADAESKGQRMTFSEAIRQLTA